MIGMTEIEYTVIFTDEMISLVNNLEVLLNQSTIVDKELNTEHQKYVRVGSQCAFSMVRDAIKKIQIEATTEMLKNAKFPQV